MRLIKEIRNKSWNTFIVALLQAPSMVQNQAKMSTDFRITRTHTVGERKTIIYRDLDYSDAMTEETNFSTYKLKPWPICVIAESKIYAFLFRDKIKPLQTSTVRRPLTSVTPASVSESATIIENVFNRYLRRASFNNFVYPVTLWLN